MQSGLSRRCLIKVSAHVIYAKMRKASKGKFWVKFVRYLGQKPRKKFILSFLSRRPLEMFDTSWKQSSGNLGE